MPQYGVGSDDELLTNLFLELFKTHNKDPNRNPVQEYWDAASGIDSRDQPEPPGGGAVGPESYSSAEATDMHNLAQERMGSAAKDKIESARKLNFDREAMESAAAQDEWVRSVG